MGETVKGEMILLSNLALVDRRKERKEYVDRTGTPIWTPLYQRERLLSAGMKKSEKSLYVQGIRNGIEKQMCIYMFGCDEAPFRHAWSSTNATKAKEAKMNADRDLFLDSEMRRRDFSDTEMQELTEMNCVMLLQLRLGFGCYLYRLIVRVVIVIIISSFVLELVLCRAQSIRGRLFLDVAHLRFFVATSIVLILTCMIASGCNGLGRDVTLPTEIISRFFRGGIVGLND